MKLIFSNRPYFTYMCFLIFLFHNLNRYSNIIEDQPCYLATTSVTSRIDPEFSSSSRTTKRSNSQNRILSPTFNSSASLKDFRRRNESGSLLRDNSGSGALRLDNSGSLKNEYLPSSGSSGSLRRDHSGSGVLRLDNSGSLRRDNSGSLRLDNFVTLQRNRRRSDYVQQPATAAALPSPSPSSEHLAYYHATSPPMVLSPSATRQFYYSPSLSREGSVTPKFSHSCSNASIVSESTAD